MSNHNQVGLRKLGSTDLKISALGLGCWQFSKGTGMVGRFWPILELQDVREIVKISLEGGINWFDTAEVYGNGQSEQALAEALNTLEEKANSALIATKWWPVMRGASSLVASIDERLQALQGRKIDLYQIHQPYSLSKIPAQMDAMAILLRKGNIRHAGISNFNAKQMQKAHRVLHSHGFPLVSNQVKYSLLDRRIEHNGVMQAAKELGMTIIAYSPLEQGILSGKFHKNPELLKNVSGPRKYYSHFKSSGLAKTKPLIDLLERLAEDYQVTTSQIALNWLINFHGDTVVAIPGASKVSHAKENIGALTFQLSESHLEEINQVSKRITQKP